MKCVKCGAEMKEGCIYCSVCGNEAQIVPDYSVLEDDYLRSLLTEEERAAKKEQHAPEQKKHSNSTGKKSNGKKSNGKKPKKSGSKKKWVWIVAVIVLIAAVVAGILIKLSIDNKNANSYDYQINKAQKEAFSKNYDAAIDYYTNAITLQPKDIPARMAMVDIYMDREDYDSAIVLLSEVIDIDAGYKEAYQDLIAIYEKREDYASIAALADGVTDTDILALFDDYIVATPIISPDGGTYDDYIDITLFSIEDYPIYYTLDGTEPTQETGTLYDGDKGICIEENGTYKLQAICYNEKGIASDIATETYRLSLAAPDYPKVTPDGGWADDTTLVTIETESYCSVYYTWDNTDPTTASAKYESPLEIPSGKSVLSVLVVDNRTGLSSGIYRTNFTKN